jgi:hypothetical protein
MGANLILGWPEWLRIRWIFSSKIGLLPDGRARDEFERVVRLARGEGRWGVL